MLVAEANLDLAVADDVGVVLEELALALVAGDRANRCHVVMGTRGSAAAQVQNQFFETVPKISQ